MKIRIKVIVMFIVTQIILLLPYNSAIASLTDIKGHWAEQQISEWIKKGTVKGYPNGTFAPDRSITRAEFITLVNEVLGFHEKQQATFKDVFSNDWFCEEVSKAVAAGYIKGYENHTLQPDNPIKREEVAMVIFRLLALKSGNGSNAIAQFTDANSISPWAKPIVAEVIYNKLMRGYPDQTFRPAGYTTRAEALVTLDKVFWVKHPVLITPLY